MCLCVACVCCAVMVVGGLRDRACGRVGVERACLLGTRADCSWLGWTEHTQEERATLQALYLGVCGQVAVGMHDVTLSQRHCVIQKPRPQQAGRRLFLQQHFVPGHGKESMAAGCCCSFVLCCVRRLAVTQFVTFFNAS